MKNNFKNLISAFMVIMLVLFSTLNTLAYNTPAISTGDSRITGIVVLSIILVVAIIAIILLSKKWRLVNCCYNIGKYIKSVLGKL